MSMRKGERLIKETKWRNISSIVPTHFELGTKNKEREARSSSHLEEIIFASEASVSYRIEI